MVTRSDPFQRTFEVVTKFEPVAVSVKELLPTSTVLGDIKLKVGDGLVIVKLTEVELPPPGGGLYTVTGIAPPVVSMEEGTVADKRVLFKKVVTRSVPFQRTFEVERKFVPLTVRVKEPDPAVVLEGDMFDIAGIELLTEKVVVLVIQPSSW